MRAQWEEEKRNVTNTFTCLDWAFAGKSHTKPIENQEDGRAKSHSVWDHWIDSKSSNPAVDEGDLWTQDDGDVLERGKQKHPETGEETEYEELWHDLDVIPLGRKGNRSSVVMRADAPEEHVRGLAIKIGSWCQAILKVGDELTIERWEHRIEGGTTDPADRDPGITRNNWIRTFKVGKGTLPCKYMCSNTLGKIGLNTIQKYQTGESWESETEWRVLEEYYW